MLTGIIQEGLQDLMIQYLQLKLDFGIKDQVHFTVQLKVKSTFIIPEQY